MADRNWLPAASGAVAVVTTSLIGCAGAHAAGEELTTDFFLEDCHFEARGSNQFFHTLNPGDRWVYEGEDDGQTVTLVVTVLRSEEWIELELADGTRKQVRTRVVEERESVDGEVVEVSRNFFARCVDTDDVYYFGEDVDFYRDGEIVGHAGAWRAGRDGAMPGLVMPGTFLLGSRYYQEIRPGVAMDRAEHVRMSLHVEVPAGRFERCVEVEESSPLEPGSKSTKLYCPGVGLVQDEGLHLVSFRRGS
jgi:hypothetical protein